MKQGAEAIFNFREAYPSTGLELSEADLSGADLKFANLRLANLSDARLRSANLSAAVLIKADFSDSIFGRTTLADVDLSTYTGLASVTHLEPSSVGLDTIFRSGMSLPDIFLRGCGVDETFLTYRESLLAKPIQFYSCFISHNKADRQFARQLHDRLQGKGIRCWLDEKQLNPGDDLYAGIDRGIRVWDKSCFAVRRIH